MNNLILKEQSLTVIPVLDEVRQLADEHQKLETHIVLGRKMLYELLENLYALLERIESSPNSENIFAVLKKELLEHWGIKTQANTSNTALLIRYVTRSDRKAVHLYSRAICMAKDQGIKSNEFIQFLGSHGGLEKIRADGQLDLENDLDLERLNLVEQYLSARAELPYSEFGVVPELEGVNNPGAFYDFYVTTRVGNRNVILCKIPSDRGFENIALKRLAQYMCNDIEKARSGVAATVRAAKNKKLSRLSKADSEESI